MSVSRTAYEIFTHTSTQLYSPKNGRYKI